MEETDDSRQVRISTCWGSTWTKIGMIWPLLTEIDLK